MLRDSRIRLFLLEFCRKVQDFVHNNEKMIAAPLRIAHYKFGHNSIDFLDNVHSKQFFELNLTRGYNCSNNFKSCGVKLGVANLEVFEKDLDKSQFLENQDECWVSFNNDREKLETEERKRFACGQYCTVAGQEFSEKKLVE